MDRQMVSEVCTGRTCTFYRAAKESAIAGFLPKSNNCRFAYAMERHELFWPIRDRWPPDSVGHNDGP